MMAAHFSTEHFGVKHNTRPVKAEDEDFNATFRRLFFPNNEDDNDTVMLTSIFEEEESRSVIVNNKYLNQITTPQLPESKCNNTTSKSTKSRRKNRKSKTTDSNSTSGTVEIPIKRDEPFQRPRFFGKGFTEFNSAYIITIILR